MSAVRKLIVEVCDARNLSPKDGKGSSSPYVSVDFDGQNMRSSTKSKDLNPQWNERFEFLVSDPQSMSTKVLHINVLNDKRNNGSGGNFLGRLRIYGSSFAKKGEEALVYFPLEKRSMFSNVRGEIGLKIYYVDEEAADQKQPKGDEEVADQKEPKADEEVTDRKEPKAEESTDKEKVVQLPASEIKAEEKEKEKEKQKEINEDDSPTEEKPAEDKTTQEALKVSADYSEAQSPISTNYVVGPPLDYSLKYLNPSIGGGRSGRYDLVEQMQYLYVRVIKARELPAGDPNGSIDPYVKVTVGSYQVRTRTIKNSLNPVWDEVFAIGKDRLNAGTIEITLWKEAEGKEDNYLGSVSFDPQEVPTRVPPESPLAPQWYRVEDGVSLPGDGRKAEGHIMVALWMGTQADEAFPQAWQSDTGGLMIHTRSKVYLSPRLWYLRVNVIEAHELQSLDKSQYPQVSVKAQVGFQLLSTRISEYKSTGTFWNEDLVFVCAEPFEDILALSVVHRVKPDMDEVIGEAKISLNSIERTIDHRRVSPRWFNLENSIQDNENGNNKSSYGGRIHVRACFDGGYHVMDEAAHLCSDVNPTAKQLWRRSLGVLEIGILGARNLIPMKSKDGRGSTDAYCVAKYGNKWVRSRTILDNFNPKWNEQYTWEVYDPCTVLTLAVFDNSAVRIGNNRDREVKGSDSEPNKDQRIGKVRIRISTLETDRIYTHSYPLLVLHPTGLKKMGEIELAVRFSCFSFIDILQIYTTPILPKMHYLYPFALGQQHLLTHAATRIVAARLSRSEPALPQEVVGYVLDTETHVWSMRRSKAVWFRIMDVLSGPLEFCRWVDDIRQWRNPTTTVSVHVLYLVLVSYPQFILSTFYLYMVLVAAWNYRFRPRVPPHMDARLSHVDGTLNSDELHEEFDSFPTSSRSPDQRIRMRYDRLRSLAGRIQTVLGDLAAQGERLQSLPSWRDPRATAIFMVFCMVASVVLYVTPFRVIAVAYGFYFLRHPRCRAPLPSAPLNFFRRLPALSDRML